MAANDSLDSDKAVTCFMFPDTPGYCDTLVICKRVSASVSLFGTIFVLSIIILFKRYQYFSQRLIINLCVGSLVLTISFFLVDFHETSDLICVAQGALLTFSAVSVCGWIVIMMANLYVLTFYDKTLERFERPLTVLGWLLPVVMMAVPFAGDDVYGPAGVWCWMKNDWRWRFGLWYIVRITSVIMFIIVSIRITYHLVKMARLNSSDVIEFYASHEDVKTLRLYPICYFLVNLFPIINRIQNSVSGADESHVHVFELILLQTVSEPLVGAALALAFMLDKKTLTTLRWSKIKEAFQACCKKSMDNVREYPVGAI